MEKLGLVHSSGRTAFEAKDEARSRVDYYENRGGLDTDREAEFRRHKSAWRYVESEGSAVPANPVLLGDEFQARGDSRPTAQRADRTLEERRPYPAVEPALESRSLTRTLTSALILAIGSG